MRKAMILLMLMANVGQATPSGGGSSFDPSGYIVGKEAQKSEQAAKLTSQEIVRINGQRYMRLVSAEGSVYLPSPGETPDFHEEFAICQQHLRLMREVLPVRAGIAVSKEAKARETHVVDMIRKCNEGRIAGPTVYEKQPDGAVVEMKAPKKRESGNKPLSDR